MGDGVWWNLACDDAPLRIMACKWVVGWSADTGQGEDRADWTS